MKRRVPFGSSLRARVMVGVIVPLIVVLGLAAYVQFAGHRELMLEDLEQVSLSVGEGVEASLARAMLSRNTSELAAVAQDLGGRASIRNLMILDMRGNVRIASKSTDAGTHLSPSDPTCQVCHGSVTSDSGASFVLTAADGARVFRNVTPIRNAAACQGCHGTSAKLNGVLVIDLPYDPVEARLWTDLRQNILLALAAIILVAVAINLLLNRIVVAKLERFGEALTRFAKGEFDARVPAEGKDEIGQLAQTLNTMAESLGEKATLEMRVESSARELERKSSRLAALYRVALESSRSLDLDQVMSVGLENAVAVTEMKAGEIYLANGNTGDLHLRATAGTPPEFAAEEDTIRRGECFCGGILVRGETQAIGDLLCDSRVTRSTCRHCAYCAIAAVPLKARGRAFGVLALHGHKPRDFPEDELALLSALGDQLGIALDNAILYAEMESRVQGLSRQVQYLAVSEERVRIGREMHDGIAQTLSLLNLKLRMAQTSGNGQISGALEEMREIVDMTYEDVRQAIGDLRMPLIPDTDIVSTLTEYAQSFALRYDLQGKVTVAPEGAQVRCSPSVQIQVVRIVQEALANVRKHSHANQLDLHFDCTRPWLRIRIRDDGQGFESPPGLSGGDGHFGLSIMRERAASVNGDLQVESRPNGGTMLILTVPIEET